MPGFNGRGPMWGGGPSAGKGRGPCNGGMSWRRGGGRGWFGRFWGQPKITEKEETEMLEQELEAIKQRLAELKAKK